MTYPFFIKRGGHIYGIGETFEGSRSQVGLLARRGLVDSVEEVQETVSESSDETINLSALTVAKLREICADRGIEVPKRVTKAQLIALLDE